MIVIGDSRVTLQIFASLIDDYIGIIYDRNTFIVQAMIVIKNYDHNLQCSTEIGELFCIKMSRFSLNELAYCR